MHCTGPRSKIQPNSEKDHSGSGSIADFGLAAVLAAARVTLDFESAAASNRSAPASQANDLAGRLRRRYGGKVLRRRPLRSACRPQFALNGAPPGLDPSQVLSSPTSKP